MGAAVKHYNLKHIFFSLNIEHLKLTNCWNEKSRLFTETHWKFCLWFRDTAVAQEQSWGEFTSPLGNPQHYMIQLRNLLCGDESSWGV